MNFGNNSNGDVDSFYATLISIISTIKLSNVIYGSFFAIAFSFLLPINKFLLITSCLIVGDLITGIIAAWSENQKIQSRWIARTLHKFIVYFIVILLSRGMSVVFMPIIVDKFYITWLVSGTICLRELRSVYENLERTTGVSLEGVLKIFTKIFKNKE